MQKPDGGRRLRPDASARQMKIAAWLTARAVAERGIPCTVRPGQAQVFLLRPDADKVWVSLWKPWLKSFAERPVSIAYGTGPGEKEPAETIRQALLAAKVEAEAVPAAR